MESYYQMQLRQNPPSIYSRNYLPDEVSEYELGRDVLGQADTYTKKIKILNTLNPRKKRKVIEHEKQHLKNPSLPEELVRDITDTWQLN
jgi:hypothetical protein